MNLFDQLVNKWFDFVTKRKIIMISFFILLFVAMFILAFLGWIRPDPLLILLTLSFVISILSAYTTVGKIALIIGLLLLGTITYFLWMVSIVLVLYIIAKLLEGHRIKRLKKIANASVEKLSGGKKEEPEIIIYVKE